jgi:hypothetical protein
MWQSRAVIMLGALTATARTFLDLNFLCQIPSNINNASLFARLATTGLMMDLSNSSSALLPAV